MGLPNAVAASGYNARDVGLAQIVALIRLIGACYCEEGQVLTGSESLAVNLAWYILDRKRGLAEHVTWQIKGQLEDWISVPL